MKTSTNLKQAIVFILFIGLTLTTYAQPLKKATNEHQVLPVSLTSFILKSEKTNEIIVNWSTASEANSSHFEVLVSKDGKSFHRIGMVNSAGNSNTVRDYQFIIREVASIKFNGAFSFLILLLMPSISNRKLRIAIFSLFIISIVSCSKKELPEPNQCYIKLIQVDLDGKTTDLGIKFIKTL